MARRELWSLSLYQLLASNRGGLFLVYFPIYLVTAKQAPVAIALALVSVAYVASSLTGPLVGRWSDRVGRRRPFLLGAELGALPIFLAVPFLPTYWGSGLGFVAAQIVLSVGSPALNAYVTDLTRQNERGEGYGMLNLTGYLGQIAGFLIVALLVGPFGVGVLFPFVVAVMVGTVTVVFLLVPDQGSPVARETTSWKEARPVLTFSVAVSIRALGIGAVGTFFGVYATGLGASNADVAFIAVAGLVSAAVVALPFGRLVDRIGEVPGVWYGTILSLIGIVIFLAAPNWEVLVPGQAIRLMGVTLYSPAMLAWVANIAPPGHRAEYLGIFGLVNSTLWSLGPLAGGISLQFGGVLGLFLFAIGTTVISLVMIEFMYLYRRRAGPSSVPHRTGEPVGSTEGSGAGAD